MSSYCICLFGRNSSHVSHDARHVSRRDGTTTRVSRRDGKTTQKIKTIRVSTIYKYTYHVYHDIHCLHNLHNCRHHRTLYCFYLRENFQYPAGLCQQQGVVVNLTYAAMCWLTEKTTNKMAAKRGKRALFCPFLMLIQTKQFTV